MAMTRVTLALVSFALCCVASPLAGQAPAAVTAPATDLVFEVASVKPQQQTLAEYVQASAGNTSAAVFERVGIRTFAGGRFTAAFTTLRSLILRAYDVRDYQLEGGPAWASSANFEINAKAAGDATPEQLNAMLKALLAERFALRTRTETRQMPQYVLTMARSDGRLGPSLKPTPEKCIADMEERKRNPPPRPPLQSRPTPRSIDEMRDLMRTPTCGGTSMMSSPSSTTYSMSGLPLSNLVSRLSSELNAPVVDRTGLTGPFDMVLEYEPVRRASTPLAATPQALDVFAPPLPSALQTQLGIKLEKGEGPLAVVIIESVEQPTPD